MSSAATTNMHSIVVVYLALLIIIQVASFSSRRSKLYSATLLCFIMFEHGQWASQKITIQQGHRRLTWPSSWSASYKCRQGKWETDITCIISLIFVKQSKEIARVRRERVVWNNLLENYVVNNTRRHVTEQIRIGKVKRARRMLYKNYFR